MPDRQTPPHSPLREHSHGSNPLHVPNVPSRLREAMARSPDERNSMPPNEQDNEQHPTGLRLQTTPFPHPERSDATSAAPESMKEDGDEQATGTLIEPTPDQEDERTALLENYHYHNHICGLRNCNHGTFSPRPISPGSTTNNSIADSDRVRYGRYEAEHPQARDFAHAILGDPIGDAIMGTRSMSTSEYLAKKHGVRNTKMLYVSYYLPCLKWINQYRWSFFRGDLIAALTMASFYIPMSLSYAANLGHIPPLNGIYAFVVNPMVYAILGSCPQMAVGPEAPGSLLVGTVVSTCIKNGSAGRDNPTLQAEIAGVVTATAGAIIFVAGLARLGWLDNILSKPFLRGFISAIGIVIFVDQAIPELGLSKYTEEAGVAHGSPMDKLIFLVKNIKKSHGLTAAVSWGSFTIIMIFRELKNRLAHRYPAIVYFPDRFLVVVFSTLFAWLFEWDKKGLELLGEVRAPGHGVLQFHWPFRFEHMQHVDTALSTSLLIASLGFFESSVAAKSLGDGTTGLKGMEVSPNRELIALGSANLLGGCFMALPAFGGYGRSKVNVSTGGTTPMSSALLSVFSILVVYFLLPLFDDIPKGVLSAMISVVAYSLLEEAPHDIKFFIQIRGWSELALMAMVCLATIFYSLNVGMALGIGLSVLQIVRHATKPRIQILGRVSGQPNRFENAEGFGDETEYIEGCLIVKIPEPLTFANTGALKSRLRRFEKYGTGRAHPSLPRVRGDESNKNVIFDIHGVTSIDGSGVQILTEIVQAYINRGARVVFCRLPRKKSQVWEQFKLSGIVELCGRDHFVGSIEEALKLAEAEELESYYTERASLMDHHE